MEAKLSDFLNSKRKLVESLVKMLEEKFSYVSILGTDVGGKTYVVTRNEKAIRETRLRERGFVARIYNGIGYSEYSFNSLTEDNLLDVAGRITETAVADFETYRSLSEGVFEYPVIEEEALMEDFTRNIEKPLDSMTGEEKLEKLREIHEYGLSKGENLIDFRAFMDEMDISKIFVSSKRNLSQRYVIMNYYNIPLANYNGAVKYALGTRSGIMGLEVLDNYEETADKVLLDIKLLENTDRIKPGTYDIICSPAISGLIAHEAFGHGVEMDMFVKGRAKGAEYIDKKVGSDILSMHDGAKSADHVGSYFFDDEGVLGTDTLVIGNGTLKAGISDLLSALKLGTAPTGNGKRQSFERKAYARMTNTFFSGGASSLDEMMSKIDYGFLLDNYFSGMEDPKNWGIQCEISIAKEIRNGKLTGKIFSPVFLTGYVPDLLESIDMISGEVKLSGSGFCGKGYKELVKNSNGGAYIKARGILG